MGCAVFFRLSATTFIVLLVVSVCVEASNNKVLKCLQPVQGGRCFGYVPSFAYNARIRKCESFIYGGCDGNDNRFPSKAECERACRDV